MSRRETPGAARLHLLAGVTESVGAVPAVSNPVTLRELRKQADMLAQRAGAAREQFAEALASMDYVRALASQLELEQLESELSETSSRLYLVPDR